MHVPPALPTSLAVLTLQVDVLLLFLLVLAVLYILIDLILLEHIIPHYLLDY
jgi:hypothetical protein